MKEKSFTVSQVAEMCGVSRAAIQNRIARGTIKAEQVAGYLWLVSAEEVSRLKKEGKIGNLLKANGK
jgi:excisionase family DNA binding protein